MKLVRWREMGWGERLCFVLLVLVATLGVYTVLTVGAVSGEAVALLVATLGLVIASMSLRRERELREVWHHPPDPTTRVGPPSP
jgi:hypothetical protein